MAENGPRFCNGRSGFGSRFAFNSHQGKTGQEGILIARLRFDQSRAHFENNMNALVVNVEIAYWNLYNKYGHLYSFETNL